MGLFFWEWVGGFGWGMEVGGLVGGGRRMWVWERWEGGKNFLRARGAAWGVAHVKNGEKGAGVQGRNLLTVL